MFLTRLADFVIIWVLGSTLSGTNGPKYRIRQDYPGRAYILLKQWMKQITCIAAMQDPLSVVNIGHCTVTHREAVGVSLVNQ